MQPSSYAIATRLASATHHRLRRVARQLVDIVLPPRCLSCSEPLGQHGALCAECWPQLHWVRSPHCGQCGLPFSHALGENALCGACLAQPPRAAKLRTALAYNAGSRRLVARFKYQDATLLAPVLGEWMLRAGAEILEGADVIVPVPLHWRRLLWRRFNQAALLGAVIAARSGLPMHAHAMQRTRHTRPQAALSRAQRLTNVRGLFRVNPRLKESLTDKIVLLVDDVQTTGATLEACAKALLKAGAKEVRCLTLARTLYDTMPQQMTHNAQQGEAA